MYFPEHHLLYASDTLVINEDNTLYDPELMNKVVQAVRRKNLQVDRVFAMHQGPTAWSQVLGLLEKSQHPLGDKVNRVVQVSLVVIGLLLTTPVAVAQEVIAVPEGKDLVMIKGESFALHDLHSSAKLGER